MTVLAEGVTALTSLRSLYEIAREVRNSNDPEKLRAAAGQMFDLAFAAREQFAALQEGRNAATTELNALKTEIERAKGFDEQARDYVRERTITGATVYREKDSSGPQGDSPYYCPRCFSDKRLAIMNPAKGANTSLDAFTHTCSNCSSATELPRLGPGLPSQIAHVSRRADWSSF
ncbi:MAG TPA: hypothetical protein VGM17_01680 [Rhizomicrobium sp.]|jgi:hypothetical protein